jgi:hypothetical protein
MIVGPAKIIFWLRIDGSPRLLAVAIIPQHTLQVSYGAGGALGMCCQC